MLIETVCVGVLSYLIISQLEQKPRAGAIEEDAYGDTAAIALLKSRKVDAVRAHFAQVGNDWSQRYFYALALSRQFPERRLKRWAATEPDSADAHLVLGARLLRLAMDVRGYGRGQSIGQARWKKFHAALDHAERVLQRAAELLPADPTPWVYMISVAMHRHGSSNGFAEQRCFEQAIARDPDNWHAHIYRLIGISRKYGGSHEMMFEFARGVRATATPDSLLHCLILKAHAEYAKYLQIFEGDAAGAQAYARDPAVIAECQEAYERCLASRTRENHDTLLVRINAAAVMWRLRQKEPLRAELQRLAGRLHDAHWSFLAAPRDLARARQFAFS